MMTERDKIPYEMSLNPLLESLVKEAQSDGIISIEESELISRIQIDAREFEKTIAQAREKYKDKSIEDVYNIARKRIIESATNAAKLDGKITDDEQAIINRLIKELDLIKNK